MLLSIEEAKLFFRLHSSLMRFVNERLGIISSGNSPFDFTALPVDDRRKVVTAFVGRTDLIDSFITENPALLSGEEMEIVSSWRHLVADRFLVLRQLKNHIIFLPAEAATVAYGVLALSEPFDRVIGPGLPAIVETVLLPFRGRIIYDGIAGRFDVRFGGGAKRNFEDCYRAAKKRHGIVTSLPLGSPPAAPASSARAPKPRPVRKIPAADAAKTLEEIFAMTNEFCQAHLNEEYAGYCRKLAEKLARKRPSPLLRGRTETWACGIIRTIGWVNFLEDRTTRPFMKLTAIDRAFGVAESTGQGKSKAIRRLLKIHTFDPNWTLPSLLKDNPRVWMLEVDGFIVDIRNASIALQRHAFAKGLIPYVPAEQEEPKTSASGAARVFQFKITLLEIQPPIWRRIQVLDDTVDALHEHIQAAMGWTNSHLYHFHIDGRRYGDPQLLEDDLDGFEGFDSTSTMIHEVVPQDGAPLLFEYEYDFGDSWDHAVLFEGSPPLQPDVEYPLCLEGERACPPEDVGGVWGYAEYLEALADPMHERHKECLEWSGPFNPEAFNPRRATQAMQEGVPDWRTMV